MVRIRRLGVVKTATTVAMIYVVIIAVFAIPVALLAAVAGGMSTGTGRIGVVEVLTFALIAMVLYGLLGWIFTAIACALYNFVAGLTGGIEVQVEAAPPSTSVAPAWGPPGSSPPAPPSSPAPPTWGPPAAPPPGGSGGG